jgi:hypothetical protein
MDNISYYRSLTDEIGALRDRVRQLIGGAHWSSDGAWKESILKAAVRRHLPANIGMGSGFIAEPQGCSTQLDIVFYDNRHPVLFRDGDFVVVPSKAVRGIVEVKTTITTSTLPKALNKLVANAGMAGAHGEHKFVGLFAYESALPDAHPERVIEALSASRCDPNPAIVNCLALGSSAFTKYFSREVGMGTPVNEWRSFRLPDQAPGYFIATLLRGIVGATIENHDYDWFAADPPASHLVARG